MIRNTVLSIATVSVLATLSGCASMGGSPARAPVAPELIHPNSDAPAGETVYTATPTMEWTNVARADGYAVYISEYTGKQWELVYSSEEENTTPLPGTSVLLPAERLQDEGKYRWNVRGWSDEAGWGPYSEQAEFQVVLRTDSELMRMINEHLSRAPSITANDIDVSVNAGEVTLSGCVGSNEEREKAHEVTHSIGGVMEVYWDDLREC